MKYLKICVLSVQWFDSHSLCILTSSHSLDFVWDSVSPFWLSLFLSVSLMYTVVSLPSGWRMWGDPVWCSETPSCYVLTIMPVFYHGCLFEFRARKHFSIGCYCVLRPKVCVSDDQTLQHIPQAVRQKLHLNYSIVHYHSKFWCKKGFIFLKEIKTSFQQGCIQLIKSDSKDLHIVAIFILSNKCCSFQLSTPRILKKIY